MRNPFRRALPPPPATPPPIEDAILALQEAKEKSRDADRQARNRRRSLDPIVADIIANLRAKGSNA